MRNKILKRKEVLKHPCVLSPPWNLVPPLGAHIPPPPLLLSLSEFYIVLQPPPFYFFSLPTLILRHYGKVLVVKKKSVMGMHRVLQSPVRVGFVRWDYLALGFYLSPSRLGCTLARVFSLCPFICPHPILTAFYERSENIIY